MIHVKWIERVSLVLCRNSYPEVFCTKTVIKNFGKVYRKTPVPESFFNKVAG